MVTLARRILDALAPHVAGPVFGLPGVHNLAFWREQGHGDTDVPRILVPRHEQTTVYAADGQARSTGRLGVALTTTGPGAANALAAFGEAAASRSPVLVVASEVPTAYTGRPVLHAMPGPVAEQSALFAPLAKAVFAPRDVEGAVEAVAAAVAAALTTPAGPVYLGVPTDLLACDAPPVPSVPCPAPAAPRADEVLAAARVLDTADRVVLWVGGGARFATDAVRRLAHRLGAPVVTTYGGRGVLPDDDPCSVGLPPHEPEIAELIGAADALLVVGSDLDGMTTRNWSMPRPPRLVRVDADPRRLADPWPADAAVCADAGAALDALATATRVRDRPAADLADLRDAVRRRLSADPRTAEAVRLVDAVDAAAAAGATVVCDMAVAGYWAGAYTRVPGPGRLLYPVGWGTLGFGLPAAVGVASTGRPALAVCGDAGTLFGVGELATIAQEQLPVVLLVVDDEGYGMLRFDQDRVGDPRRGVDLAPPDFVALAASFGIAGRRVDGTGADLGETLADAVAAREPRLVTVRAALTPPRTTSPRWREGAHNLPPA